MKEAMKEINFSKWRHFTPLLYVVFGLLTATAAMVSDVTARQRYPWNGMVDIDYTITGADTEDTAIAVKVTDTDTGKVYTPTKFLEVPPTVAGRHRITWSTEADGLNLIASNVTVTVSLLKYDAAAITNDLFYVIDLSGGPDAERWPVSYLNAVPKGGWTDEYKTTKLVMRRIEKGRISGINGGIYGAASSITIDKPYYIGVFEVTSAQYALMKGGTGDARPQICLSYNALRGTSAGALYPDSMAVDATSIIGILRAKTGLTTLDLPTEVQWEYACRAGTTSDYNNGGSTEADLATLGRYKGNQDDGRGGYSGGVTTVGSYAPNRWGLYDMHGNAYEWCLEWYSQGQYRALRGGSDYVVAGRCRSGKRDGSDPSNDIGDLGFRLCCSSEIAIDDGTGGAVVANVMARPRYPWNGKVDVSMEIGDGLAAHWPFDGDMKDASGNGHDLRVGLGQPVLTEGRGGLPDTAYDFDGDSYLRLREEGVFAVSNNFSIALWFKTSVAMSSYGSSDTFWNPGNDVIFAGFRDYQAVGVGVRVGTDGVAVVEHGSCYRPTVLAYKPKNGMSDGWHHVVVTVKDNGGEVLYVDGQYAGTAEINSKSLTEEHGSGTKAFWFDNGGGGAGVGGGQWGHYTGSVDDVRVYDRALSGDEVAMLYGDVLVVKPCTVSLVAKDLAGGTNLPMRTVWKADGTAVNPAGESVMPGTHRWVWDADADLPDGFRCDRVAVEVKSE